MKKSKNKNFVLGKKTCESCGQACPAACKKCPNPDCGVDFTPRAERKREGPTYRLEIPSEYRGYEVSSTIYVPAGPCPINLKEDPTQEDLTSWAHKMRLLYLKNSLFISNYGLLYFLKYKYDWQSEEYLKIKEMMQHIPDMKLIEKESQTPTSEDVGLSEKN